MAVSRSTIGLLLLAGVALALRVAVVVALGFGGEGPRTYEHGEIAANLVAGRGFTVAFLGAEGPTSQQAPFYPVLLAGAYGLFGQTTTALVAMELLQCLAGTALVLCVVWLAWSLFPERPGIGWFAGVCAAVYPPHLYMVTHIQVVCWAALSLTLLLAMVASRRWAGTWPGRCWPEPWPDGCCWSSQSWPWHSPSSAFGSCSAPGKSQGSCGLWRAPAAELACWR